MGTDLLTFYQTKIKKSWKLAFCAAFLCGFLVHIYKFTNMLPNGDSLYNFYSSQNMVTSGRWFLSIACGFSSWFDLPWLIGLLSLCFMGVTAAMVAEVFHMENPVLIILCSALQVSFPAITATMTYEYTADGYMLAMVLAAASVCLSKIDYLGRKHWIRHVCSCLCICLTCGIYQGYVSFAFILAVCYFMTELLENRREDKQYWKWIGLQILIYVGAMAAYYVIWKLCLHFQDYAASSYQGIDNVGKMGVGDLVDSLRKIVRDCVRFFLEWNILDHGVTVYSTLNILFLLALAAGLVAAVRKSGMLKRKSHLILFLLCVAALPLGCWLWHLTSPSVYYHALMLQSVCLIYVLAAVVFDRWIIPRYSNALLLLLTAIVFNNSVCANICYNYMHQSFVKSQSVAVEVSTRVHMLDEGNIRYIAFFGGLDDWNQESMFAQEELRQLGGWKNVHKYIMSHMFLQLYTDFDLAYYRGSGTEHPLLENGSESPSPRDSQLRFPLLGSDETLALGQTEAVQNMPVWPHRDSVQVIGDTVVVKFSDYEAVTEEPLP